MRTVLTCAFLFLLLITACENDPFSEPAPLEAYEEALEEYVMQDSARHVTEHPEIQRSLLEFYEQREYAMAWADRDGLHSRADSLLTVLEVSNPDLAAYRDGEAERLREGAEEAFSNDSPADVARLDAHFTRAYMRHALHLHAGRVDPTALSPAWDYEPTDLDLAQHLQQAIDEGNIQGSFTALAPQHESYEALRSALEQYRQISRDGGWPEVPGDDVLTEGDTSSAVPVLRERLRVTGDLRAADVEEPTVYDGEVAEGVANFQRRHALQIDGALGPETRDALNVPVEERLRLIEMNLERWHWLPTDLGERYIVVNLPAYELQAYEDGRRVQEMAVVIGEEYDDQATPVFTDEMDHLIFNPYWNVPESIAEDEVIPEARDDIEYLAENDYEIVSSYGPDGEVYESTQENLDRVEAGELFIRQESGPQNALGRVKFMFPNEYAIYLHDTPEDHLFDHDARGFSHGCVRVERPADLAEFLLQDNPGWDRQRIETAMYNDEWQQVDLEHRAPIYLLYWTAYADPESGEVHFNEDVYQHDEPLHEALYDAAR